LALGGRNVDPRRKGSGNVGATNVARLVGKRWFPVVFLLDAAKGAIPPAFVHFSQLPDPHWAPMLKAASAGAAVAGHVFSVFLRMRGGKGVATTAGALAALAPLPLVGTVIVFAVVLTLTRFISLASVVAALVMPVFAWWYEVATETLWFTGTVAVVILVKHHTNIFELDKGGTRE
jgi:glycerol-3-phosphate acyltransferase PlsY